MPPPIPPAQLDDTLWTSTIGPGIKYTVGYKAGQDDIRFNFENDNSTLDLPVYFNWANVALARLYVLGFPLVAASGGGFFVSRYTPMTTSAFLQLSTGLPYLYAVQFSGTGWGVPDSGIIKDSTISFPIYKQTKCNVHFETLTYNVLTDAQMVAFGYVDADGNPDEATLARYVTIEITPGTEYLSLPQGAFQFVTTPAGTPPTRPAVAGTAGKLVPNYDISLTWELVPLQCVGTVLYNPTLEEPPIDDCLGCVNDTPFPPAAFANEQGLFTASHAAQGTSYLPGDILILLGGVGQMAATVQVLTISAGGGVASVGNFTPGSYVTPPASPCATATTGVGNGCTLTVSFAGLKQQKLMTAYPAAGGTGYALGNVLALSGGVFGSAAQVRVVALGSAGTTGPVLAVEIISQGNYSVTPLPSPPANPVSTTTTGAGTGCTLNCEFGIGIPPGQLLMTAATITPIRSSAGDRLYRLAYRFKYLPQGVQRLYYQGSVGYVSGPTKAVSTVGNTDNPLITTSSPHGFSIGQVVAFAGTGTTLDGKSFQIVTVPLTTTFTVLAPAPGAGAGGTVGLSGAYQDGGYFEVSTNGFTNIGVGLYNNDAKKPPVNIYPWADFATLFRVPS